MGTETPVTTPSLKPCCQLCHFYSNPKGYTAGDCRRFPPGAGGWSQVRPADWCGEFQDQPSRS